MKLTSKEQLFDLRKKLENDQAAVKTRILVGVSSCGIAAGSREVLAKFEELIKARNLTGVVAEQTGCVGYCYVEPTVEIKKSNGSVLLLGGVTENDVQNIIDMHVVNDLTDSKYVVPSHFSGCFR